MCFPGDARVWKRHVTELADGYQIERHEHADSNRCLLLGRERSMRFELVEELGDARVDAGEKLDTFVTVIFNASLCKTLSDMRYMTFSG